MVATLPDTRTRLLDIAAERFLEDGYAGTTLRNIAGQAGVKAGSIYYHFDSKDAMLAAVLDEGIARMTASLDTALEAAGDDPCERLRVGIRAHLAALFEHGAYTACHVRVFHQAPIAVRAGATVQRDAYEAKWQALIDTGHRQGVLEEFIEPRLARLYLLGALNATIDWFTPGDVVALAGSFAHLFINGSASKGMS